MAAGHGFGLGGEMRAEIAAAGIARCPAETIGEEGGGPFRIGYDGAEGPIRLRDDGRLILRRQAATNQIDARRLVLSVPSARKAAREAEAARTVLGRNHPDDAAA